MNWNAFFVVAIVLFTISLIHRGGSKKAFYLMTAFVPATGFFVDVGVSLSASKVICLLLSISLLHQWFTKGITGKAQSLGLVFLAYAAIMTMLGRLWAPTSPIELNEFRVLMRPAVQWLALCLQMLPLFLAPLILRSKDDVADTVKAFFWGAGLLALGGVLQWVVLNIWGVNIFPIYREGLFGDISHTGEFALGDEVIFRANSLAREPKDMGAALVIALTIWLLLRSAGVIRSFALSCVFVGTLLVAIVFSFSTSAAFLLWIAVIVLIISSSIQAWIGIRKAHEATRVSHTGHAVLPQKFLMRPAAAALFLGLTTVGIFVWYDSVEGIIPSFSNILDARVLDRVGMIEDYDQVALDFLMNESQWGILGVGAGNLPWYAFSYLPYDPDLLYMQNLTWNAKSGLLTLVTSYGLVGLVVLLSIATSVLGFLTGALKRCNATQAMTILAAIAGVLFISTVHAVRSVDEIFWLALGVAVAHARMYSNPDKESPLAYSQTVAKS